MRINASTVSQKLICDPEVILGSHWVSAMAAWGHNIGYSQSFYRCLGSSHVGLPSIAASNSLLTGSSLGHWSKGLSVQDCREETAKEDMGWRSLAWTLLRQGWGLLDKGIF